MLSFPSRPSVLCLIPASFWFYFAPSIPTLVHFGKFDLFTVLCTGNEFPTASCQCFSSYNYTNLHQEPIMERNGEREKEREEEKERGRGISLV